METTTKEIYSSHTGEKRETITRQSFPSEHTIVYEIEVSNE